MQRAGQYEPWIVSLVGGGIYCAGFFSRVSGRYPENISVLLLRFRSNIRPPERFNQTESSDAHDTNARRNNRFDDMSLKCSVEATTRSFKSSFFFRTHLMWNDLPTELKHQSDSGTFQSNLKLHLWDVLLDPH